VAIVVASDRTSDSGSVKHGYPAARGFGYVLFVTG
jgi:hypothetical protein